MTVRFNDYSVEVITKLNDIAQASLEEASGELESQIKRNTAVASGQTKGSWQHRLKRSGDKHTATIGSPLQNAIWEEFGTGEYALNGDGRKGGWSYQDERGEWHFTRGKHPRRPAHTAYTAMKKAIIKFIQGEFKRGMT